MMGKKGQNLKKKIDRLNYNTTSLSIISIVSLQWLGIYPCADPEGGQLSYPASIQCWAIIGTPAKRHSNGVLLAGR